MTLNGTGYSQLKTMMEAYPSTLVVMFYDAAIESLEEAAEAAERGDVKARFAATSRAADVIAELQLALDRELGGEVAEGLDGVYRFVIAQVPQINIGNDAVLARRLVEILQPLRDAWAELDRRLTKTTGEPATGGEGVEAEAPRTAPRTTR